MGVHPLLHETHSSLVPTFLVFLLPLWWFLLILFSDSASPRMYQGLILALISHLSVMHVSILMA